MQCRFVSFPIQISPSNRYLQKFGSAIQQTQHLKKMI